MTYPTAAVVTTNLDAGTDSPASARTDLFDAVQKLNQMIAHTSAFAAALLDDASASAARATLGSGATGDALFVAATAAAARSTLGAAASGANSDITSLTALSAGGLPDNSVLTADIADAQVTPAKLSQPLTTGASVATTSGTSVDITGIPSWARKIVLTMAGVSTSGTSLVMVQIGDSGGVETSGYSGAGATSSSGVTSSTSHSAGFTLEAGGAFTAASVRSGHVTLVLCDASNTWVLSGVTALSAGNVVSQAAGHKQLSATLDRVRLTTVGGTDTFDAGAINIVYE